MYNSVARVMCLFIALCAVTPAQAALEDSYTSGPRVTTPWYGYVTAAQQQADQGFIAGMRPHHAGALTMSNDYLSSADSTNAVLKQLARAIIRNQTFEIGMLDTVEKYIGPPVTSNSGSELRQIAEKGLAQSQRFFRAPAPGPLDKWAGSNDVSVRDVQFAKAMIIHHEAALDMAHDYLAQPEARNGYLELMCLDILVDQSQEIALMQSIIADYQGDADAVKIDDSMIHGMEGMHHGGTHKTHKDVSEKNAQPDHSGH